MQIATPSKIWPGDAAPRPPKDIEPGQHVQVFVKLRDGAGFDSVWCRITRRTLSGFEAVVVDGPDELRGKAMADDF